MTRETRENTRPGDTPDQTSPEDQGQTNTGQPTQSSKSKTTARKKSRAQRVPLGKHRAKLAVDPSLIPPNKVGRWINDHPGRLLQAEQGGYTFVDNPHAQVGEGDDRRDRLSTKVRTIVGSKDDSSPLYAYLMVIDKDFYEEDQREKQKQVDEIDKAIKAGSIASEHLGADDAGKTYIPKGGITYDT